MSTNDSATVASGAALIAAERKRQQEVEGWTLDHDREHGAATLYRAASCYEQVPSTGWASPRVMVGWPWDDRFWKPKSVFRNLVRAGALYQAGIDVAEPGSEAGIWSERALTQGRDRCVAALDALIADVLTAQPSEDRALRCEHGKTASEPCQPCDDGEGCSCGRHRSPATAQPSEDTPPAQNDHSQGDS